MTMRRVRARTAAAARRKVKGKRITVTKVNMIKGSARKGSKTFSVTTRKRKRK